MKLSFEWQGGMAFAGGDSENRVVMDTRPPLGRGQGLSPKQLLVAGVCGCTAMDVVAMLRKYKMEPTTFVVEAEAEPVSGHPAVLKEIALRFVVTGEVVPQALLEAITLSQTKYCGVSAMVNAVSPIRWEAVLNGSSVGTGRADFGPLVTERPR